MPANDVSPPFAWLSEVDASGWTGTVMDFGGGTVLTLPTDQSFWEDGISFACGRGSEVPTSLPKELTTTGGAQWNIYIDTDDLVTIENDTAAFTLTAGSGEEAYGFTASASSTPIGGGIHQLKAQTNWVRGVVTNAGLELDDGGGAFTVPTIGYQAQDVVIMFRDSITDADSGDRLSNLQYSLNNLLDNASRRYRCGINDDGFFFFSWDSPATNFHADVFANSDFQRWLGFDGTETDVASVGHTGTVRTLTANLPCAGWMGATRPLRGYPTAMFDEETNTIRLTSGELASTQVMTWRAWSVPWMLDGPKDERDLSNHFLREFMPRVQKGARLALYQVWGDSRRARYTADVRTDASGTVPEYDLLGTAELDGRRGRIRGRRGKADKSKQMLKWPGRLERRIPMTTIIEAAES